MSGLASGTATFTDASATQADVNTEVSSSVAGFPTFATVLSVVGTTVTMSANYTGTATTGSVTFYSPGTQTNDGYGTVDFDLSSRAAKTSGGNCDVPDPNNNMVVGDELACDTFWGVASDGVGVFTFDSTAGVFNSQPSNPASVGLSAQDLFDVFNCDVTEWGQLPEWQYASASGYANLPAATAPIVPWTMNSSSGTFGDFNSWIAANATGVPSGWTVNNGCDRELSTAGAAPLSLPIENDFKPLVVEAGNNLYNSALYSWPATVTGTPPFNASNPEGSPYTPAETFPAGVTTSAATSPQNPNNWIWFSSFGLLSQFPFLGNATVSTTNGPVTFNSGVNSVSNTAALNTTVAAGSNGATLSSLVGGALNVASTTGFGATGDIIVTTSSGTAELSYTGTTATTFSGIAIVTGTGTSTVATGNAVNSYTPGSAPSSSDIQSGAYPILRILNIVTPKASADCPLTANVCNFLQTNNPGPTNGNGVADIDVTGATSGTGGAIREFVRFLCRVGTGSAAAGTNLAPVDPFTGATLSATTATGTNGEINTAAVEGSGFRPIPVSKRSPGSTCDVVSFG